MARAAGILVMAAVAAFGISVAPQLVTTADAAGCVKIHQIYYDSPGSDYGSNSSLNAEWIQLKNTCSSDKNLGGWRIRDTSNHWYSFGSYTLRAGTKVKIHTGDGSNTRTDRYQGREWYVWNNTGGDKGFLFDSSGSRVDTCYFSGGSPGYEYC
jgi:hypothetical protein